MSVRGDSVREPCERIRQLVAARSESFLSRIERIVAPAIRCPPNTDDLAASDDDRADREMEALVAAGDESRDIGAELARSPAAVRHLFSGLSIRCHRRRWSDHPGTTRDGIHAGRAVFRNGAAFPGRRERSLSERLPSER